MSYIGNTPTTQAFTPAIDYFSGNGSTTAFTLSRPVASVAQVQVTIDNVAQNPSSAYTVSANTITFTSAPLSGTNNIYVYYTSPITQVIAPGQGTVTATSMASSTGTGAGVFQTSPTLVTPVISSLSSASATALTLQSAGTTAITVDTSQNVGIGGAATNEGGYSRCLQVTGATEAALEVKTGSSYSYFAQNGTTLQIRNNATSGVMTFATVGVERMRIDADGNFLVGATSYSGGVINTDGTVIRPDGFVGIRASGYGNYAMQFFNAASGADAGNITVYTSTVAYNTSSDYRLKENIAPMTGALAKVAQLKPVTYKWKVDGTDGEGFIAHELAEVKPDCVSGDKDAVNADGNPVYQGVDTSFLVATLTAAIQELKAINDTQAETINALTARIVALEGR
jgi:hypothetical protein